VRDTRGLEAAAHRRAELPGDGGTSRRVEEGISTTEIRELEG
jgi:hypothetical protein